ncbi:hypothetical protein CDAR_26231 [Caerostris darwini]|uniref:Uncharacterized protein n=1 Tax=Caerostris darwini TaxID=1538125 RepID=A0AAV4NC97_9ARAC|nr:hypothetical protein CDAR_26231 [Caerostris darwini]
MSLLYKRPIYLSPNSNQPPFFSFNLTLPKPPRPPTPNTKLTPLCLLIPAPYTPVFSPSNPPSTGFEVTVKHTTPCIFLGILNATRGEVPVHYPGQQPLSGVPWKGDVCQKVLEIKNGSDRWI